MPLPHQTDPPPSPLAAQQARNREAKEGRNSLPAGIESPITPAGAASGAGSLAPDSPGGELQAGMSPEEQQALVEGTPARSTEAPAPLTTERLVLDTAKTCPECKKSFKSKKAYNTHMTKKHPTAAAYSQAASVYQGLHLDSKTTDDGLVWKALCKTGTLALSPGPGQMDVEKPLELTPDMFNDLHRSVEEKAFPHVTVPETHANGVMENTGYVRKTEIRDSTEPTDPPGTKVLWGGIDFTEPEVKERALRGSIADISVGVKFDYRNKRSGKTYGAALEHAALTNQPWVDGLTPFGQSALLSQDLVDAESLDLSTDWRGVYVDLPQEDILSSDAGDDSLPLSNMAPTKTSPKRNATTVEEVLASHQATIEAQKAEIDRLKSSVSLSQGTIASQGEQLHAERIGKRIAGFEGKVPPATLRVAQRIMLADYREPGEDASLLKLSIQNDEGETEEAEFGASEIVEQLLASLPETDGAIPSLVLDLSAATSKPVAEKSTSDMADEMEAELYPDRFDSAGKRIEETS